MLADASFRYPQMSYFSLFSLHQLLHLGSQFSDLSFFFLIQLNYNSSPCSLHLLQHLFQCKRYLSLLVALCLCPDISRISPP